MEFSKKLIIWLIIFCALGIIASYVLAFYEKQNVNDTVTVALITTIMGACVSYLIYQFKLKDSRNKHGIDENGKPIKSINN
jgi:FtsH-binding integral membrane protein